MLRDRLARTRPQAAWTATSICFCNAGGSYVMYGQGQTDPRGDGGVPAWRVRSRLDRRAGRAGWPADRITGRLALEYPESFGMAAGMEGRGEEVPAFIAVDDKGNDFCLV